MSRSRLNLESMSNLQWVEEDLFFFCYLILFRSTDVTIHPDRGRSKSFATFFFFFFFTNAGTLNGNSNPNRIQTFFSFVLFVFTGNTSSRRLFSLLSFFCFAINNLRVFVAVGERLLVLAPPRLQDV